MLRPILISLLFHFLLSIPSYAQNNYPTNYFGSPIPEEISLAGNFGEIRPDHFHSGIDIKTQGKEGMLVFAAADGFVSRINISPYGYGKAIYVDHPNGYTTVYAHLKGFNKLLDSIVKEIQYSIESFEVDTAFQPKYFVKKGELIGLSGNTGGSQGPHLHFEIRDTKTEMPINPQLFGFKTQDSTPPQIKSLTIYPLDKTATINGENKIKKLKTYDETTYYRLGKEDTLMLHGNIGFGIECFDKENNTADINAVYSIELQSGGRRMFYSEFDKFSFDNTKYVNAHIDYAEKENSNIKIQKCFVSKNNQLGIYKGLRNNGIVNYNDNNDHWMRIILKDNAGNTSMLIFKTKGTTLDTLKDVVNTETTTTYFNCMNENQYEDKNIKIKIPNCALYDDIDFKISETPQLSGFYSPVYHIHNRETAVHRVYNLSLRTNSISSYLTSKACIVSVNKKGRTNFVGGEYSGGWITAQCSSFGDFSVLVDSLPPTIKPGFKIHSGKTNDFTEKNEMYFKIYDNLSGIKSYKASIDGKWVLFEYDAKTASIFYTFDKHVSNGNHTFKIEVSDKKNNFSFLNFNFIK